MHYKNIGSKEYPSWFNDSECEAFDKIRSMAGRFPAVGLVIEEEGFSSVFVELDADEVSKVSAEMIDSAQGLMEEDFPLNISFVLSSRNMKGIRYGL